MKHINNVCFCKCHEMGKAQCGKCKNLHRATEKAATHKSDTNNPDIT